MKTITIPCVLCGKEETFEVTTSSWLAYLRGVTARVAFPLLSKKDQEFLATTTHDVCPTESINPDSIGAGYPEESI